MEQQLAADINLNKAECLRTALEFGAYRVHNVCSDAVTTIPWGGVDWLVCFGVAGFGFVIVAMFGAMAWSMFRF